MNSSPKTSPKVSVGIPVFNGELFLKNRLDSICSQTFTDFELVISDNASTDSTSAICQEYEKKDGRIHYIKQKKNMGVWWNYKFIVEQAKGEYFVWAAADDWWKPDFLEKNVKELEANKNLIGSISEVRFLDLLNKERPLQNDYDKFVKHQYSIPAYGSYEQRIATCLRHRHATSIYAVYRTKSVIQAISNVSETEGDLAVILNLLKYGNFHVLDELLMYRHSKGMSTTKTHIEFMRKQNYNLFVIAFPYVPFTKWCLKNLGLKIFMKNISFFIKFNYRGQKRIFFEVMRKNSTLKKIIDKLIEFKCTRRNRKLEK